MPDTRLQLLELLKQIKDGKLEAPPIFHDLEDKTIEEAKNYLSEMSSEIDPLNEIKKSTD